MNELVVRQPTLWDAVEVIVDFHQAANNSFDGVFLDFCLPHKRHQLTMMLERIMQNAQPFVRQSNPNIDLPPISGVYAVMDDCYQIYYIGKSHNIRWRFSGHQHLSKMKRLPTCQVGYMPCGAKKLSRTEANLILACDPPWNKKPSKYGYQYK